MRSIIGIFGVLLPFLAVGFSSHGSVAEGGTKGLLRAGAARVDITPDTYPPLAGYGTRRGRASKGVHDPIYARAIVLDNGQTRVAICNMDLVITTIQLKRAIWQRMSGTDLDALFLSATHNHSGAGGYIDNFMAELVAMGSYDEDIFRNLVDKVSRAITKALENLRPAVIGWNGGSAPDFCVNRRPEGGRVDPEIGVIDIEGEGGRPIALLVNFGAHPTILGPKNMLISGDFPGFLARYLEKRRGVVLFANGASADVAPRVKAEGNRFGQAKAMGESLGQRVLRLLEGIETRGRVRIESMEREILLPSRPDLRPILQFPLLTSCLNLLADVWLPEKTKLGVIAIDDLLLIGVPCDLGAEVGLEIKESVSPRWGLIISQTNDYIGYVITRDEYREGGYEAKMSFFGPGLADLIKREVLKMIGELGVKRRLSHQGPHSDCPYDLSGTLSSPFSSISLGFAMRQSKENASNRE